LGVCGRGWESVGFVYGGGGWGGGWRGVCVWLWGEGMVGEMLRRWLVEGGWGFAGLGRGRGGRMRILGWGMRGVWGL